MSERNHLIYFGVDPGKSGAIAAIWDDGKPFGRCQRLDATEQDIVSYFLQFDLTDCAAIIEKVHSTPQMGVTSAFTFGRGFGLLLGILSSHRIPFSEVSPQKWQKAMECMTKGDKNVSKRRAQQLWPSLTITHRNADALLIAEYGRRFVK
jgi:Holliday junction resolvasome RuvABC endonuclease subunit